MKTILIIDDEPSAINILNEVLKSNYKIIFAEDGKKGLSLINSMMPPDLILLDIIMPGMDGYEVCKILKSNDRTVGIPIIFVTIKGERDDGAKGFELGAADYIVKPFEPTVVKARVKALLELHKHKRNKTLLGKNFFLTH